MKRRREMVGGSEIKTAVEELSMLVKQIKPEEDGVNGVHVYNIPTRPFLNVCSLVIQVLDKIGPTMAVLRQDIDQNIQKLEKQCDSDPTTYSNMVEILKEEVEEGNARKTTSCSRAFVWLTRSLDFSVDLLGRLTTDPGQSMEQAVEESYNATLKPWHGWISFAAFKVAIKLVPDNMTFMSLLMAKDDDYDTLLQDIHAFISSLVPLLKTIHSILVMYGLDRLKST